MHHDTQSVDQIWETLSGQPVGHLLDAAIGLNGACRFDEADVLLARAVEQEGQDPSVAEKFAQIALDRGDWQNAADRADQALERFPDHGPIYRIALSSHHELLNNTRVAELQAVSEQRFPTEAWPLSFGARFAEMNDDLGMAESFLNRLHERFPGEIGFALDLAAFQQRTGRLEAATQVVQAAAEQAPNNLQVEYATIRIARAAGHWAEAQDRKEALRNRFPNDPWVALRWAESPVDTPLQKDPSLAFSRLEGLHAQFPDFAPGYSGHIAALRRFGQPEAARTMVQACLERFRPQGAHIEFAYEMARIKEAEGDKAAAKSLLSDVLTTIPNQITPYVVLAALLSRDNQAEEAERVCQTAIERFRYRPQPLIEFATLATRRGDFAAALERWQAAARLCPREEAIRLGLFITRLAIAEQGDGQLTDIALSEFGAERRRGSLANVLMKFESLGGPAAGGCEFAYVQRKFGAEPVGLLRWGSVTTPNLIAALESRFEGLGTPGQTVVELPGLARHDPQYYVRDTRFDIQMHTFVNNGELAPDELLRQWRSRLSFFKRKLVRDLELGDKIFLYRPGAKIDTADIERLAAAMRGYGDSKLFVVQIETAELKNGTVLNVTPLVLLGYIDRLNWTPGGGIHQPNFSSWAQLCTEALRVAQGTDA